MKVVAAGGAGNSLDGIDAVFADDGVPLADIPVLDEAAGDIGIDTDKIFNYGRRVAAKEENCSIDQRAVNWVGKGATEQKFASMACSPRQFEMRFAELWATAR